MKKTLLILILFLLVLSCKKEDEEEYKDVYGEIIYTDSFSPTQWEVPLSRKKIIAYDRDIGKFIKSDIMDPKLRQILQTINNYIKYMEEGKKSEIKKILTGNAFNSFNLRYTKINVKEEYEVRVAYPESLIFDTEKNDENIDNGRFDDKGESEELLEENYIDPFLNPTWIKFKILFKNEAVISKVEISFINDECIISDIDILFFSDLENVFTKKNEN